MPQRYEALPDSMKPEEVAEKITEFLSEVQGMNVDVQDASDALCESADRQWHTYEYLDTILKSQVDNWVTTAWNNLNLRGTHGLPDSWAKERLRIVENLISAIGMFGLSMSYQVIKNTFSDDPHTVIRSEIENTVAEFGEAVDDPYQRLKQQLRNSDDQ